MKRGGKRPHGGGIEMTVIQLSPPTHRVQDRNCVVCETTTARHQCNCKTLMMDLASKPGSEHRHGYLRIHKARPPNAKKMKGKPLQKYRSRMKHLPYETRQYIKEYPTKDHYIGYGHYPPDVTKLNTTTKNNNKYHCKTIT